MSVEDFLGSGIVKLDNNIEERVRKASINGNVLRYVCVIEGTRYSSYSFQNMDGNFDLQSKHI